MASVNFSPMSDGSPFPSFQPQLHCTPPIGNYIQHNGLITPLASPIKTDYPEPVGCPPALELNPPEPQPKKRERQTTISEHLKSTKKTSTGNPRGRPRKHPLKEGQLTAAQRAAEKRVKQEKAAILVKLESFGFQPRPQQVDALHALPNSATMEACELCELYDDLQAKSGHSTRPAVQQTSTPPPEKKRKRQSSGSSPAKAAQRTVKAGPVLPPSPPLSPARLTSPPPDSPAPSAFALFIDPISGQASLKSSVSGSSLPSLSAGSTRSTSVNSLASFAASFGPSTLQERKMTKADVPGMGRVLFERTVLVSRLGEQAAARAIETAEAATLRRSTVPNEFDFWSVNPVDSETATPTEDRFQMVRKWLEVEAEVEEEEENKALFQPIFAPFDPLDDFGFDQEEEEVVVAQGGKSVRVLKRRKTAIDEFQPVYQTTPLPTPTLKAGRRSQRAQDGVVACICDGADDDTESGMVQCDACRSWFHLDCLGKSLDEFPEDVDWFCHRCEKAGISTRAGSSVLASSTLRQDHSGPVLVKGSPRVGSTAQKQLDFHLFGGELFGTPSRSPAARKRPFAGFNTPSLSRHSSSEWSFSPKTPGVGFARNPRPHPSVHLPEDAEADLFTERLAPWEYHAMQTPSRSAGLAAEWSMPLGTPSFSRKYSAGSGAGSAAQEFFQDMHTPKAAMKVQHHVSFEEHPASAARKTHRRVSSVPHSHSSLGQTVFPTVSALKQQLQPPALVRTASGLGIGFGSEASVRLDDLIA